MRTFLVSLLSLVLFSVGLPATNGALADLVKQDPGIYVAMGDQVVLTDLSLVEKSGVGFGQTMKSAKKLGFGQKYVSRVSGASASARVSGEVRFIMKGRDFVPDNYILVRMKSESDRREVAVGKNTMTSKKSEIDDKDKVNLEFTKEGELYASAPVRLDPGEYGFITKNSLQAEKIYTFTVVQSTQMIASTK